MEYEAKIVVVGDSKVGKSTWVEGHQDYQPYAITTGVDFRIKEYVVNSTKYILQYWDCPGAQRSRRMIPPFCVGAAFIVYIYDTSSHASFESLTEWYDLTATNEHVERILLGNLPSQGESEQRPRAVGIDQAKRFARDCKMEFFEVKLGNSKDNMQIEKYILEHIEKSTKEKELSAVELMQRNIRLKSTA